MTEARTTPAGHDEPHGGGMATRLNWLRAAVLGANDGIVSTACLMGGAAMGVTYGIGSVIGASGIWPAAMEGKCRAGR